MHPHMNEEPAGSPPALVVPPGGRLSGLQHGSPRAAAPQIGRLFPLAGRFVPPWMIPGWVGASGGSILTAAGKFTIPSPVPECAGASILTAGTTGALAFG